MSSSAPSDARPGPHANLIYALECQPDQETHGEHEGSENWFPAQKRQPLGDHDWLPEPLSHRVNVSATQMGHVARL
jgi:hypothetical protein